MRKMLAVVMGMLCLAPAAPAAERLTARPLPKAPVMKPLEVGASAATQVNQRRRVVLPDGSIAFLNQASTLEVIGARKVKIVRGEVFLDVPAGDAFVIEGPSRKLSLTQGGVVLRADQLFVTRGQVRVEGVEQPLTAGQKLDAAAKEPAAAPRSDVLLGWTRELMAAAGPVLVPGSEHAGGTLMANTPAGEEVKLSLRRFHVDVVIEDGFARTTIDQTYFNAHTSRLEGTFRFPLPADASLSRLAMYVGGELMEGGMVERDYGRAVYESIVHQQQDPALLEWLDGTTFKMRVFPLEPRQEKRLLLCYTQRLTPTQGRLQYRFPAGHSLDAVAQWSLGVRVKGGAGLAWSCGSHTLTAEKEGGDLLLSAREKAVKLDRDVVLEVEEDSGAREAARLSLAEQDGAKYLMLRYRPQWPAAQRRESRDWMLLVETSADRNPLLARAQIELARALLAQAEAGDTFNVATANTRLTLWQREPQPLTPSNLASALTWLEQAHLIGALDLDRALRELAPALGKGTHLVHLGGGVPAMGERRQDTLIKRLPEGTRYVGVGVGRRWNRPLMKAAAEHSGGLHAHVNPDEPLSWRAFELGAALDAPRLLDVRVSDPDGKHTFLLTGTLLNQGEELCAVARLDAREALPRQLVVRGTLDGRPLEAKLDVADVSREAAYLPRHWARLQIDRLLAEDSAKHKAAIIELSKAQYVMTPFTSLLVLENDDMYTQYKVERNRRDLWAPYPAPARIKVVSEPIEGMDTTGRLARDQVLRSVVLPRRVPLLRLGVQDAEERFHIRLDEMEESVAQSLSVLGATSLRDDPRQDVRETLLKAKKSIVEDQTTIRAMTHQQQQQQSFAEPADVAPMSRVTPRSGSPREVLGASDMGGFFESAVEARLGTHDAEESFLLPQQKRASKSRPALWQILGDSEKSLSGEEIRKSNEVSSLLYRPLRHLRHDQRFADLLRFAPGLSTRRADVLAVLEAEAEVESRPGTIDEQSRVLFTQARKHGWMSVKIPAQGEVSDFTITFDAEGRFVYERTLPPGLRELAVCDGKTLWLAYPDLGLAARRTFSRFHRQELQALVPWALPAPENLARGADLKHVEAGTMAVIPHGAGRKDREGKELPYSVVHLIFARDGRLTERRLVAMPQKRVLSREVYDADGTVRRLDRTGRELSRLGLVKSKASEPVLTPKLEKLVVLDLPYRTPEHVRKMLKIEKKGHGELTLAEGLPLLASYAAQGQHGQAREVFTHVFERREQRPLGLYVLLASAGANLDKQNINILGEHLHEPLAQYLALYTSPVLREHASQWAVGSDQFKSGFLQRLALAHALLQRWQDLRALGASDEGRSAELKRAEDYIKTNRQSPFAWALLTLVQQRAEELRAQEKETKPYWEALARLWALFVDVPELGDVARYEEARALHRLGQSAEAAKRWLALHAEHAEREELLRIDGDFRRALLDAEKESPGWAEFLRRSARERLTKGQREAVMALAWQCWQLDDEGNGLELVRLATDGIEEVKERDAQRRRALQFYWHNGRDELADALLRKMLADPKQPGQAELWLLAAALAERRDMPRRRLECLEKADALGVSAAEQRQLQSDLLNHYRSLARSMVTLGLETPGDFKDKVVRAADRWRALYPEMPEPCERAEEVLRLLGDRDLAWDYATTPLAHSPYEASAWVTLGEGLARRGEAALADRALAAAFEAEPTNAQILFDRAQRLRQAGKVELAKGLYRQLAVGTWQPRFRHLQEQARAQLDR